MSLSDLRAEIDRLDDQLVTLINARAGAAARIGRLKSEAGMGVFAPDREHQVLDRVTAASDGPVGDAGLRAIYREIMSASFALERMPTVAFLGPNGSYTHEAAMGKFGASVGYEPVADIAGVFEEIARDRADYGVVPIENRIAGAVADTLDAMNDYDVKINCEIYRAIHHNLMARCPITDIEAVYSRPEAAAQCQRWLAETGLAGRVTPASSTSRAAQLAAESPGAAAIGGKLASRLYDLPILAEGIEDDPDNVTRFFVIGREPAGPTGDDRTSLTFVTAHRAGALVAVLLVLQRAGINMSMITSLPGRRPDRECVFFVDVDGHQRDAGLGAAIEEAELHCQRLRVLGSYPRSTNVVMA